MFNDQFKILIRDINYGQHLDHLSLLGYLHETRVRYFNSIGYAENDVDGKGSKLIVTNLTCDYKSECFYGDIINIQLSLFQKSEIRLVYKYQVTKNDKIVAIAEITTAFLDNNYKVIKIPANLLCDL